MLLSSAVGVDLSSMPAAGPLGADSADQWVPYVPSAEQTKMQAQSVADLTAAKVAIYFRSPGYQVGDWGIVKHDGNSFYVDAQVEQWTGPIIEPIRPITLEHQYDLGKLDPSAKYRFTFEAWGKEVETLYFSADVQVPVVTVIANRAEIPEPVFGSERPLVPATVTVTRTEPSINNLDVVLKLSGSATPLKDYNIDTGWQETAPDVVHVQIPAGQTATSFFVVPLEDNLAEGTETVVLALAPANTYKVGVPDAAKIAIIDAQPQWIPYVPTADQTSIAVRTEAGVTQVEVSLHLWSMRFRVADWGQVQQDGSQFLVDSKVEEYVGPMPMIPEPVDPPPIVHDYALGVLKPGDYSFVFIAWGTGVQKAAFAVPTPVELPTVKLEASDPIAVEPTGRSLPDNGEFRVTRSGSTDESLLVHLISGGTATRNMDYTFGFPEMPPFTDDVYVTIPAGKSSATLPVAARNDILVEGDETVVLKLVESKLYTIGTSDPAMVTIKDAAALPLPVVAIKASDPLATEPDLRRMGPMPSPWDPGTFTVVRTGPVDRSLMVNLKFSGTADDGPDYHFEAQYPVYTFAPLPPGESLAYFPEGVLSSTINLIPHGDNLVEGDETVVMAIVDGPGYDVGTPDAAKVVIQDTAVDQWIPYVPTPEETTIDVQTLDGATKATVKLALWDLAYRVTDWGKVTQDGDKFIVDAKVEQYTGRLPLMPVPIDLPPIVHEYPLGELKPGSYSFVLRAWGKDVEAQPFTIPAGVPVVTIKATDPIATEPAPLTDPNGSRLDIGQFTLARTGPITGSTLLILKVSGTATEGVDYHFKPQFPIYTLLPPPPGCIFAYFPDGQATSSIDLIPLGDRLVEGDETVVLAIVDGAGYDVGTPEAAKVVIQDSTVDQWIPYVPTAEQTELVVSTIQGLTIAGVTLQFGSPGFEVRDWGKVQQIGNEFVVDTKIEQWTGPVIMIVPPPVVHRYEIGAIPAGEYTFTFKAWGKTVESLAFKVGPSAPAVSVIAADPIATEPIRGGPQPRLGLFKVVRLSPADSDLLVHLKVGGTATHGDDYLFGAFDVGPFTDDISIMIPAGHSWVPIPVLARADAEVEGVETVVLTVAPADTYDVGADGSNTVSILDTRSPFVRVLDPNGGPEKDLPVALPDGSGKLDLQDNQLIVQLPEGQDMGSILSHVADLVRIGRNGGSWTGGGITSSVVANTPLTGLAIVPEQQTNQIRVQRTYYGDANLDGIVNADDYFQIDSGFISQKSGWYNGDFNYDGAINADDYFLIDSAYIGQSEPLAASMPQSTVSADVVVQQKVRKAELDGILSQLFSTEPVL